MARRFESNECPRCRKEWSKNDLLGRRLIKIKYEEEEAWGAKVRCECGIDLFLWLETDSNQVAISYFHTFNTACNPAERFRLLTPRPEGVYFLPHGKDQTKIRGLLAHRTSKYNSYQKSKLDWYDTRDGDKPVWAFDKYDHHIYWSSTNDEYFKEIWCSDMKDCDTCLKQGDPYDFEEASERDKISYFLGEEERKYEDEALVYYMGLDAKWHPAKITSFNWDHTGQAWKYGVVDLGEVYTGKTVIRREDELYDEQPDWEPMVIE